MKNIYLNAGNIKDIFIDMSNQFEGILSSDEDHLNLEIDSCFAKGNIKILQSQAGINLLEFDLMIYQNIRISAEAISNSPIFFMYCTEGRLNHSFGDTSSKNMIAVQDKVILKSQCSINSVLNFEKNIKVKFYLVIYQSQLIVAKEENMKLIKFLNSSLFNQTINFFEIKLQSKEIVKVLKELSICTDSNHIAISSVETILQNLLATEIKLNTDSLSIVLQTVYSFLARKLASIKKLFSTSININSKIFSTSLIIYKAKRS
ncbi:hypothetical protein [Flavobacterium sp. LS1P3]|uniref:hypothetical protein n=1 Tax=Flavobacterium sp. LS1P3 TaxID=3401720 RepID=UPI003AAED1FF